MARSRTMASSKLLFIIAAYLVYSIGSLQSAVAQETTAETAPTKAAAAPAPLPADYTYIVGGDVWTVTNGAIKGGTVVLCAGKIDRVGGSEIKPLEGSKVIDA